MSWFSTPVRARDWSIACQELIAADPTLAPIIQAVGPCTLAPRRDHFVTLCKAIYGQQISTAVARVLFMRFCMRFPRRRPTPALVSAALSGGWSDEIVRSVGLSRQKKLYLLDLANHFISRRIPARLSRLSDEQVIEALVEVNGIGRWTAEMFLIFALNRPDVYPVDDLGLRMGVRDLRGLSEKPDLKTLHAVGDRWRPWRSVATWYLWRYGGLLAEQKRAALAPKTLKTKKTKRKGAARPSVT